MQTRDALWAAIRRLGAFTLKDVRGETRCSKGQVEEYVKGLAAAGIVERVANELGRYVLVKDSGIEAPRVRRDGTLVTMGRGREQLWQTMLALGSFTVADLFVAASTDDHAVAESEARSYCQALCQAGYLVRGVGGYRLVRYTGPLPPMIQRIKAVYDPNLKAVVWSSEEAGHDAK
ncbi:MAG: hypothetical protein VKK97_04050 [Synechococcaceae cyanobacterium]|nr:hypothetical protein [Synechococcaceae cyanobacterium]